MDKNLTLLNQKKSALIFMIIILGLIVFLVPKNAKNSIGKCYIAFQSKEGNAVLKIKEMRNDKYYGEITDLHTKQTIKGVFSTKEISDLQPTSCP